MLPGISITMKKFTFYFTERGSSATQISEILASNHGIAISKFKAAKPDYWKILRINKEIIKNGKVQGEKK